MQPGDLAQARSGSGCGEKLDLSPALFRLGPGYGGTNLPGEGELLALPSKFQRLDLPDADADD